MHGCRMRTLSCEQYSYLSIDCECWLPTLRWDDSTDSVLLAFWCNLLYICHRVFELLLCRPESRGIWNPMRANALRGFFRVVWLSSSLHGGKIKRRGPPSAQGDIVGMGRVGARGSSRLRRGSRRGRPGLCRSSHYKGGDKLLVEEVEDSRV